ncbi:MAG: hypothetical protein HOV79_21035 [Hamadaea sp.]|nr:hypothetical protein [Hamadaea sp.]
MKIQKFRLAGVLAVAVVALSALGFVVAGDRHSHSDAEYLFAHLRARSDAADAIWLENSLAETLPSRRFSVHGGAATARNGVVIGRITDVREGRGFSHKDDAPSSTEVAFDSPDALWRTVEVTVTIEEAWGRGAGQKTVTFAVIIDRGADAKTAVNGLRSLDRVIVGLDRQGRYAYAPHLYSISHSGDIFGTVDARGGIQLPVMEHGDDFMNGVDTVEELRGEAGKAPLTIRVDVQDGLPVRR